MDQIRYIPLYAILGFVLYHVFVRLQNRRLQARLARDWNCEPCVKVSRLLDPLGILTIRRLLAAAEQGRMLEIIREMFENTSNVVGRPVHTAQSRILDSIVYTTREPKNIQAILATQFQDFSLGANRHGTFAPLYATPKFFAKL
jgi:hypothetical protein